MTRQLYSISNLGTVGFGIANPNGFGFRVYGWCKRHASQALQNPTEPTTGTLASPHERQIQPPRPGRLPTLAIAFAQGRYLCSSAACERQCPSLPWQSIQPPTHTAHETERLYTSKPKKTFSLNKTQPSLSTPNLT